MPRKRTLRLALILVPGLSLSACQWLSGLDDLSTGEPAGPNADAAPAADATTDANGLGEGGVDAGVDAADAADDAEGGPGDANADASDANDATADATADASDASDATADATADASDASDAGDANDASDASDAATGPPCQKSKDCTNGGQCVSSACTTPPSCAGLAKTCGPSANEDCCTSTAIGPLTFSDLANGGTAGPIATSLSEYRLDRYEVTVARFRRFLADYTNAKGLAAGGGAYPAAPGVWAGGAPGSRRTGWDTAWVPSLVATGAAVVTDMSSACSAPRTYSATAGAGDVLPVNCVTWWEAFLFCAWDGGRLPTYAELVTATVGADLQNDYPWGGAAPTSAHAVFNVAGPKAVGSGASGAGRYGHHDLLGNVAEHMIDAFSGSPPDSPCTDCVSVLPVAAHTQNRTSFGGAWLVPTLPPFRADLDMSSSFVPYVYAYAPPAGERNNAIGLRCARYVP